MDEFDREALAAGFQPINPDWLDAEPVGQCRRCGRKTWSDMEIGREDRMTQPDGDPCGGRIEATGATLPPMFLDNPT
jgi:hypothetical protein